MTIIHACISFADPKGKKYFPSDPSLAEESFVGAMYEDDSVGNDCDMALNIIIGANPHQFTIQIYRLDKKPPPARRLSHQEKTEFIDPQNLLSELSFSLEAIANDWKNYFLLAQERSPSSSPRAT